MNRYRIHRHHSRTTNLILLGHLLLKYGVNFLAWGHGATKPIEALYDEIESGETILQVLKGKLVRCVSIVYPKIYWNPSYDNFYYLYEEKREFNNGTTQTRQLLGSIGEKIQGNEDAYIALERGILEELGIKRKPKGYRKGLDLQNYDFHSGKRTIEIIEDSQSFPGLLSKYTAHLIKVEFRLGIYNEEGYVEEQEHKTTFFKWSDSPQWIEPNV